jgi:hypothetical protein
MTQQDGMKNYGANLTNARANAGAIVLYQHEEQSLMKAIEGLQALRYARKVFLMVNPEHPDATGGHSNTPYDEVEIQNMIHNIETQLILCRQRIQNMKETFNQMTGLTWAEKIEMGLVASRSERETWIREEDEANGTILLTKED